MRTATAETERLLFHRVCFVCRTPVAERLGVAHYELGILVHRGDCNRTVAGEMFDFTRSRRGRVRRRREVLARLWLRRQLEALR
jgi:hypothetical protein